SPTAAIVSALLESVELWSAEELVQPETKQPLADLSEAEIRAWSGHRDGAALDLDPALPRSWLPGTVLVSGHACRVPWDLLSLDYTIDPLEYPATSVGLACGNSRTEALVSGLAEGLEHHAIAQFERRSPRERLAAQISLETVLEPGLRRLLRRVESHGFQVKAWSMAQESGYAAILCVLFRSDLSLDGMAPAAGTGCHPSAAVALQRALLEAVQTHAGLVAGARDDVTPDAYEQGGSREAAIVFGSLAFGDGSLAWSKVPSALCETSQQCLASLLGNADDGPVIAYDHDAPHPGLHLVHVLAPRLLQKGRQRVAKAGNPVTCVNTGKRPPTGKVLFGGPSLVGLALPAGIEVRPPARCGDFAALLADPPLAVGLVDGYFKLAPTVWHKEIMALLACGTRVIGGASLGALRAAELNQFGMEGVGAIYGAYRAGCLVRDDAVMLIHAPMELGYAPLTVPLADAEHTLMQASLPASARRMMQRIVRTTPFETRTWEGCLREFAARTGREFPRALEALQASPSLKQMDAAQVIKALVEASPDMGRAAYPVPPITSHFRALLARSVLASAPVPS
ncbi:MAG: YcaO-like family protein, partial [Croceibacterium sp.]